MVFGTLKEVERERGADSELTPDSFDDGDDDGRPDSLEGVSQDLGPADRDESLLD